MSSTPRAATPTHRRPCGQLLRCKSMILVLAWSAVAVSVLLLRGRENSRPPPRRLLAAEPNHQGQLHAAAGTFQCTARGDGRSGCRLTSRVSCKRAAGEPHSNPSPKESDLQQQRRCLLSQAGGQPEGGYLAVCLAVKNQHRDLPEWLDYHRALGVSHFYIMDDHSDPPLDHVLAPYAQAGLVTHRPMTNFSQYSEELRQDTCHKYNPIYRQLIAYNYCLRDYGARHQFMAFIDTDEFLVISDGTPDLPTLLRDYEAYGGLGVNWRMFGSGGIKKRQKNVLTSYTSCYPEEDEENLHVKLISNMAYVARMSGPHTALFAPGYSAVTTARKPVDGPFTAAPEYGRLVLHHYATKSEQDYREKMARGSAMSNHKSQEFWDIVQQKAVDTCTAGVEAWRRAERHMQLWQPRL